MAHDVFISHSVKDKTAADAVCAILESNGIRCWIAPRDVTPSMEWSECIIEAIEQSRIMVLVFTAHANNSHQIRREVERAVNRGVAILPLRIENITPGRALEYFIGNVHWLDALTPPLESHLQNLAGTIKTVLARRETQDAPSPVTPVHPDTSSPATSKLAEPSQTVHQKSVAVGTAKHAAPRGRLRAVLGAAALLVVLAVIYLLVQKPGASQLFREDRTLTAPGRPSVVFSVAFSPDGGMLASGSADMSVKLWDVGSGQQGRTLAKHSDVVSSVAFSPDGRLLASASWDGNVRLWDLASGQNVNTLAGHAGVVTSVAFSPDGHLLASAGRDKTIRLWDVASGQQVRILAGHSDRVQSVAFSPDGRLLASGSDDTSVRLWEVATGREVRALTGHSAAVMSVAFSPDGNSLASGSSDKSVKIWEVATGREIRTLAGYSDGVTSVAFSPDPDGRWLASGSNEKTVKLWEVATGQNVLTLSGHTGAVTSVAFSHNGQWLASASFDGTIKLWRRTH